MPNLIQITITIYIIFIMTFEKRKGRVSNDKAV